MNHVFKNLPLPRGATIADYFGDMREVVQYDIKSDTYLVRYDWYDDASNKQTWFAEPIAATSGFGKYDLIGMLPGRRAACFRHRGIPGDQQ